MNYISPSNPEDITTSEVAEGRYRREVASALSEKDRPAFEQRKVYAHSTDGDADKGVFENVKVDEKRTKKRKTINYPIQAKAVALSKAKENTTLGFTPFVECSLQETLEDKHVSDGDFIVSGSQENPEVYEAVFTVKLEKSEHPWKVRANNSQKSCLKRREDLDSLVKEGLRKLEEDE